MSIDKWKELNKDWLCKMFHKEETGNTWETWATCEIGDQHPGISSIWHGKISNTINMYLGDSAGCVSCYCFRNDEDCEELPKYFKDWKRPTQQEKDMYEMISGVKIMWSEEHPFKTLEDE